MMQLKEVEPKNAHHFAEKLRVSAGGDIEFILAEIARKRSKLLEFNDGSVMVVRGEQCELVIVCFEGQQLESKAPFIINLARQNSFKTIRFHTERPALNKLLKRSGFSEVERVYRLKLGN